jgi:hypothetical protein
VSTVQQRRSNSVLLPRVCRRAVYRAPQRRPFRAAAARYPATRVAVGRPDRKRNRKTGYIQADGRLVLLVGLQQSKGSSFGDRRQGATADSRHPARVGRCVGNPRGPEEQGQAQRHRARSTAPSLVFCGSTLFPNCSLTPLDGPGSPRMSASSFRAFPQVRRCFCGRRWCAVDALSRTLNRQVRGSSPWRRTSRTGP